MTWKQYFFGTRNKNWCTALCTPSRKCTPTKREQPIPVTEPAPAEVVRQNVAEWEAWRKALKVMGKKAAVRR